MNREGLKCQPNNVHINKSQQTRDVHPILLSRERRWPNIDTLSAVHDYSRIYPVLLAAQISYLERNVCLNNNICKSLVTNKQI